jgi:two-component system, response regulator YesN
MYKVLIADDEQNIRQGIIELIDWEARDCMIIGECANGREVLDFIDKKNVDIIITDIKMPLLNGLDLAKKLREEHSDIAVIILTAFSDFNHAKDAIRYGVVDFVIKNSFLEDLPDALNRSISRIRDIKSERIEKPRTLPVQDRQLRNQLQSFLLENKSHCPDELQNHFKDRFYRVFSYEITGNDRGNNACEETGEVLNHLLPIAYEGIHIFNICTQDTSILILSSPQERDLNKRTIKEKSASLIKLWTDLGQTILKIGISESFFGISDLEQALSESKNTLALLAENLNEFDFFSPKGDIERIDLRIHEIKQQICDSLIVGDTQNALSAFMNIKSSMKQTGQPLEQSKMEVLLIFSYIMGTIHRQYKGINFHSLEENLYKDVSQNWSLYSLFETGVEILKEFAAHIKSQRNLQNDIINRASDYLYIHYTDNIRLSELSRELGVSGPYLSKLYKKETGTNLTDAINVVKIDKAKEFLMDKAEFKIYEVGEMVGIHDAGYFCNVFKKYTDMSPIEYRRLKKRIK